ETREMGAFLTKEEQTRQKVLFYAATVTENTDEKTKQNKQKKPNKNVYFGIGVLDSQTKSSLNGSTFFDRGSLKEQELPPPLRSYLCLTMLACFCPAYPLPCLCLSFISQSRKSYYQGDYDGSKRLGRSALYVSIASIIIGLLVIAVTCIVHFTTVKKKLKR
uniref:Transmembrane protein 233 n=1 Tax=Poecilia reticulata TaxID=8081 RepID=A0A3P9QBQ4_POERE